MQVLNPLKTKEKSVVHDTANATDMTVYTEHT